MGNRASVLLILLAFFGVALWGVSALIMLDDPKLQWTILTIVTCIMGLIVVFPKIPIDGKLVLLCLCGYLIGAKGFAYLSPSPPLYIGEITFACCGLVFLIRHAGNILVFLKRDILISILLILFGLCSLRIYFDFKQHGLYAIRDFAMIYYSFFCGFTYLLCKNEVYKKLLRNAFIIAICIGAALNFSSYLGLSAQLSEYSFGLISIHPDVTVGIYVSLVFFFLHKFAQNKNPLLLLLCILCLCPVLTQKSSYAFSFFVSFLFFLFFVRTKVIILFGILSTVAGLCVLLLDLTLEMNLLLGNDVLSTVDEVSAIEHGIRGSGNTTEWRLAWWRLVFDMTVDENPFLGLGFGADITSPFLREVYKINYYGQNHGYARYPHCILFTVFGRLGIIGLLGFGMFALVFFNKMLHLSHFIKKPSTSSIEYAMIAFVLAGFANAFVQATYEIPYGAIPHWIILGYLLYWHREQRALAVVKQEEIG